MLMSQIGSLTLGLSFSHNLHFKHPNGPCKPILNIYVSNSFQWYKGFFNPMSLTLANLEIHRNSNPQSGSPLGSVWVHSLALFYTPESMKCDSWASFLECTFASPCFSCKPKAKVATWPMESFKFSGPWNVSCLISFERRRRASFSPLIFHPIRLNFFFCFH